MEKSPLRAKRVGWGLAIVVRLVMVTLLAAAAPDPVSDRVIALDQFPREVVNLRGEVFHVQGLDLDGEAIYVTSVDVISRRGLLHRFTTDGRLTAVADLTDGARYHVGGIGLYGDHIWVPIAEYRPGSTSRILELDKTTLKVVSSFVVSDHIGAVTCDGTRVYGGNWDAQRLYVWDRHGRLIANVANTTKAAYQDIKFVDGALVASGVMPDRLTGTIDWLDPDTLLPRVQFPVGRMDDGPLWTREGMALVGGKLYLLPKDGRDGGAEVYVFDLDRLRSAAEQCGAEIAACGRSAH